MLWQRHRSFCAFPASSPQQGAAADRKTLAGFAPSVLVVSTHMWPFRKTQKRSQSGQSFQDFLRTYVPPTPAPIKNPIREETICPLCFERFEPGSVSRDCAFCPDCSSEGIDFEVKPFTEFMAQKTPEEFDDIFARWQAVEGLRPEYKALKSQRILALKAIKCAEC